MDSKCIQKSAINLVDPEHLLPQSKPQSNSQSSSLGVKSTWHIRWTCEHGIGRGQEMRYAWMWGQEMENMRRREIVELNQQWPVCFVFIMIPAGSHGDAVIPSRNTHTHYTYAKRITKILRLTSSWARTYFLSVAYLILYYLILKLIWHVRWACIISSTAASTLYSIYLHKTPTYFNKCVSSPNRQSVHCRSDCQPDLIYSNHIAMWHFTGFIDFLT